MPKYLAELEARLSDQVPAEYVDFLCDSTFNSETDYGFESNGCYWMIDEFFTAHSHERRIEVAYDSVSHAIPESTFPIISTLGGLILLYGASKNDQNVYYWDHERLEGEDSLIVVSKNSRELAAAIAPYVEDGGG